MTSFPTSPSFRAGFAVLAAAAVMSLTTARAWACTTCGCSQTPAGASLLSLTGRDASTAGTLRLSLEGRIASHTVRVHDPIDETTLENRWTLGASWSPLDWLALDAFVPLVVRHVAESGREGTTVARPGDSELSARFHLLRTTSGPVRHVLTVAAGLKVPTAPAVEDPSGRIVSLALQTGTGSWDPLAGLSYALLGERWSLFTAATLRFSTEGRAQWTAGRSVLVTVAPQFQINPVFSVLLALDARANEADRQAGEQLPNSGAILLYVSPTLLVSPTPNLMLRATLQWPLVAATIGQQYDSPAFVAGITYTFGPPAPAPQRPRELVPMELASRASAATTL
jgi:hypothetical protein